VFEQNIKKRDGELKVGVCSLCRYIHEYWGVWSSA